MKIARVFPRRTNATPRDALAFALERDQKGRLIWFDIQRTDVLNARIARTDQDEKHLCPLQLTVIRRAVELWTNPGDVVCTPFMGVGSEARVALELKRRAVGIEIKESYFDWAVKNCRSVTDAEQMQFA